MKKIGLYIFLVLLHILDFLDESLKIYKKKDCCSILSCSDLNGQKVFGFFDHMRLRNSSTVRQVAVAAAQVGGGSPFSTERFLLRGT